MARQYATRGPFSAGTAALQGEFNHVLALKTPPWWWQARAQAGNLAHAVHTPLAVLANAAAGEDGALAQIVREQVAARAARSTTTWHAHA